MSALVPGRGEIWFAQMRTDPPEKGLRPVVVVSVQPRSLSPRANSVLVVPLSTTPKRGPGQVELSPGETGLNEVSVARPEDITTVLKSWLVEPRYRLRRLSEARLREIAHGVQLALGFPQM